jgi:hypothetical protein
MFILYLFNFGSSAKNSESELRRALVKLKRFQSGGIFQAGIFERGKTWAINSV